MTTVKVPMSIDKEELKDWCWANVGNICEYWNYTHDYTTSYIFTFDDKMDATAFKMKFGIA